MNYVESFNLFGIEAKQIPSILSPGDPTTTTEGAVGCFYMNTDTGDIYKCTSAEGGVYVWSPITRSADEKIAQISENQATEASTNKFNLDELVTGKFVQANGKASGGAGFAHTGFIPVSPGDIVVFGSYGTSGNFNAYTIAFVAAYDSNKTAVSSAGKDWLYKKSYTVPEGIAYVVLSVETANSPAIEMAQINCTTDGVPFPYEPYSTGGSRLYPYGYTATQEALEAQAADIEALASKVESIKPSVNGHVLSSTFDALAAGEVVTLGEDIRLNRYNVHEFFCKFDTFDSVTVGHGNKVLYGSAVKVDNENIYILYGGSDQVFNTYAHGLTISEFLDVVVTINNNGHAEVKICTAGGAYVATTTITTNIWHGLAGNVFVKATQDCRECKFVWNMNALLKDVYLFGDSYTPLHDPATYPTYLASIGYDNFMICGTPGATAQGAINQFRRIMAIKHPKLVVWALGMNNADTEGVVNANWLSATQEVINYCDANDIDVVLATIPNCPNQLNAPKNEWVRNSGYRYVDFAKAVGAEEVGSSWYEGMLKSDQVHPAALGAKALGFRFLLDVPEIAN